MDWEKIKLGLWGALGGAIVLAIIGFTLGGWVTGSTAQTMVDEAAQEAVVARLAPICIEQYNRDPEKDQKLKTMKEIDSWNRRNYVRNQGWATMLGEKDPDIEVADKCADMLMQLGQ